VGDPLLSSSREPPQDSERPAALRESCESLMLLAARKRTKAAQQEGPKVASKLSTSLKETASSSLSSSMAAIVSAAITYQVNTRVSTAAGSTNIVNAQGHVPLKMLLLKTTVGPNYCAEGLT